MQVCTFPDVILMCQNVGDFSHLMHWQVSQALKCIYYTECRHVLSSRSLVNTILKNRNSKKAHQDRNGEASGKVTVAAEFTVYDAAFC